MRWSWVVLCAASCGRLQFDARPDAVDARVCVNPIGHDEDGDAIDDACDVCPGLFDDQRDSDGDGVGDACDPLPATATERIAVFDPFLTATNNWNYGTNTTVGNDVFYIPGAGGGFAPTLTAPPTRARYTIVGSVGNAMVPAHQLSLQVGPTTTPGAYYCELYEEVGAFQLKMTYTTDSVSFNSPATVPVTPPFTDGPVTLTMDHFPPTMGCSATWAGQSYSIDAPIPNGIAPETVFLSVYNVDTTLTSFTQISSTP